MIFDRLRFRRNKREAPSPVEAETPPAPQVAAIPETAPIKPATPDEAVAAPETATESERPESTRHISIAEKPRNLSTRELESAQASLQVHQLEEVKRQLLLILTTLDIEGRTQGEASAAVKNTERVGEEASNALMQAHERPEEHDMDALTDATERARAQVAEAQSFEKKIRENQTYDFYRDVSIPKDLQNKLQALGVDTEHLPYPRRSHRLQNAAPLEDVIVQRLEVVNREINEARLGVPGGMEAMVAEVMRPLAQEISRGRDEKRKLEGLLAQGMRLENALKIFPLPIQAPDYPESVQREATRYVLKRIFEDGEGQRDSSAAIDALTDFSMLMSQLKNAQQDTLGNELYLRDERAEIHTAIEELQGAGFDPKEQVHVDVPRSGDGVLVLNNSRERYVRLTLHHRIVESFPERQEMEAEELAEKLKHLLQQRDEMLAPFQRVKALQNEVRQKDRQIKRVADRYIVE